MWMMDPKDILIGQIILDHSPPVLVYVQPTDVDSVVKIKHELAHLLNTRFRTASPAGSNRSGILMSMDEVAALWRCHRNMVLRLAKRGQLHAVEGSSEMRFSAKEVLRVMEQKPSTPRNLRVVPRRR